MLSISIIVYRILLRLYPKQFQNDYGDLMCLAFEDACYAAQAQNRWRAWVTLWLKVIRDLFSSLYQEHKDNLMKHKIDQYEINATLGEGAAAKLYRAYDAEQASQVALKVFVQDKFDEFSAHIEREGEIHTRLEHPNIPKCFSFKESDTETYLVMEYINGKTLLEILQERNKPFTPQQVIEWGIITCDVLSYLHGQGYVYRDVKPSNLMLDMDNTLYVIDYGIIVPSEGDGVAIGTIGYAPPEQYKGICTVQSDIYALGATMHHLLTNRDPRYHEAHTFADTLPSAYNPDITAEFETLIMRTLSPQANARYQSAIELRDALSSVNGHSVEYFRGMELWK